MKIKIQEQNTYADISEVEECTIIIAEFDVQKSGDPACLIVLDGGGAAIPTGILGDIIFPANLKAKSWTIETKDTGSITADIWHCTYSEFNNITHPVVGDSICPSSKIVISSSYKAQDTDLSDWYPQTVNKFDTWRLNIDLCTGITKASLLFMFERV
jgi:hypothetical protein